jgi:hypothetical protein
MIITEIITHNGREFKRTYTTNDKMMLHKVGTDEYYAEAVDVIDSNFTYEEVPIPKEEIESDEKK